MRPSKDQIAIDAYHRWLRRGGGHGRDRDDWIAAEQDLVFALNYEAIARSPRDGAPGRILGAPARRPCRFCEQAIPRARFRAATPLLPPLLGETTPVVLDECDACHAQFRDQLSAPFEAFVRPFLDEEGTVERPDVRPSIPIPAYKFLVKTALAIMPEAELPAFEGTIEWVCNPNHGQDFGVLRGLSCRVYFGSAPVPAPWTSLARRVEDGAPFPAMLFFLGTPRAVFQVALPLGVRDDEDDGEPPEVPTLSFSTGAGDGLRARRCLDLPIARPR
jgi:hypothetical protein